MDELCTYIIPCLYLYLWNSSCYVSAWFLQESESYGCLLELTWNGTKELSVGKTSRKFLEDGDEVIISGCCKVINYMFSIEQFFHFFSPFCYFHIENGLINDSVISLVCRETVTMLDLVHAQERSFHLCHNYPIVSQGLKYDICMY